MATYKNGKILYKFVLKISKGSIKGFQNSNIEMGGQFSKLSSCCWVGDQNGLIYESTKVGMQKWNQKIITKRLI